MLHRFPTQLGRRALGATFILTMGLAESLYGDITGQSVISGSAEFISTSSGWVIKPSNGAIIEYTSFGVNANELIKFIQASGDSRVLNRIIGDFPTHIDGRLESNGIVYIVNPAGVFIGPDGVVDVGGIYAAAGNLKNSLFLDGKNTFTSISGRVENAGLINGQRVAALIGTNVVNSGTIGTGPGGLTAMVASNGTVRLSPLSIDGKTFVDMEITSTPGLEPGGEAGVLNTGSATAGAGGQVLLGAGDVYSLAIRNTASSVVQTPGGIVTMRGKRIEQDGEFSGVRLTADCGLLMLNTDLPFDRVRVNGDIVLGRDVTMRGEGGVFGQSFTIVGDLSSAVGQLYSFTSKASYTIFRGEVGEGDGLLGSLNIVGNAAFSHDVRALQNISVSGTTLFYDGNHDQRVTSINGTVSLGDDFIKLGESLFIDGHSVEFGGTGFSVKDLRISCDPDGQITLNGLGEQQLTSLTLVALEGDVAKTTTGMLTIGAPLIEASGDVTTAAGDLWFTGMADFNGAGDQRVGATGGDLHLLGISSKSTGGNLDLFGNTMFVHQGSISTAAGNLTFDGSTEFLGAGDQGATANGGDLRFTGDVLKSTAGNMGLVGEALVFGGIVTTTQGDLTITGDATFDGEGSQAATANGGELVASGDMVKTTGGDLNLSSDQRIRLGGDAGAESGDLDLNAPEVILDGEGTQRLTAGETVSWNGPVSKAQGDLRIIGDGGIDIGGDVLVENGRLLFRGPVLLETDATVDGDRVTFDGTLDGTFALIVNADERIVFMGDIGQASGGEKSDGDGLQSLTLHAGELVEFANEGGMSVHVLDGISFNAGDPESGSIPDVATIGSAGDLLIDCGEFLMGPRQKITVLGSLTINAGAGTVTLGDVNVLNDLAVNAAAIRLRSRPGGNVLGASGTVEDEGADLIVGGQIGFSSIPIILGDGTVQFASFDANADTTGNLSGFTLRLLGEPIDVAALRQGSIYFDLTLPGLPPPPPAISTASPATILAVEDTDEADDGMDANRAILRENERIALNRLLGPGVSVRRQLPVELERGGAGTITYDTGEIGEAARLEGDAMEIAIPRLSRDAAVRFLGAHARLEALTAAEADRERGRVILARLAAAADAAGVEAIAAELASGGTADLDLLRAIAEEIRWGEAIGLSERERRAAGNAGMSFPQSRVMATLGAESCPLSASMLGEGFWRIVGTVR
ncbi:MAG: filamentous hemagglutinin N-terminal domain-containing protein [Phycisphaerae bacterium]|jgi:filamentous hemagglutinin family protein|nr:filamentous hemagglutinin N-terminal domain-containing protein [Phycisphaerae bacterium]